ncbi:type I pantothenate kinase [Lactobacillus sp. LL6]|uniref:type I pantothenate kinase n=1 Tax=Lactobacillus sp. LL6 TaxID=2596827 RepID=UPI001184FB50|nr:type I pantothenate kinase [Lactobacillus sp. LL6]TSO25392.1 type I pantothenate kinase [Lactobacillus sp. LL6]
MNDFTKVERVSWSKLSSNKNYIKMDELKELTSLGDVIDEEDVKEIYIPLVRYLHLFAQHKKMLTKLQDHFVGIDEINHPFIIGISGSVAVGKSTTARLLQVLIQRCYPDLKVQLMTTDGFLYPNRELKKRRLMDRKGFPESYNMKLLSDFLSDVTNGKPRVLYPLYSQRLSDIVPNKYGEVINPDILIIEGINTLQLPPVGVVVTSDFFDFSIYIDANEDLIEKWFMQRFKHLLIINKNKPENFYYKWANGPISQAITRAETVWQTVDLVNLREYIAPTKNRANVILHKTHGHRIDSIYIRHY